MKLPGRSRLLLEIDLTRPRIEVEPDDLPGKLRARQAMRWRRLINAIHDAAGSDQVAGLIATMGTGLTLPQAQELREAVAALRAAGKPTFAWAESFGESGNGVTGYLLATGFGEIWLQPSSAIGLVGIAVEIRFLRGLLDKLGITPQLGQRKEYKSAGDRIMRDAFTPAHEEMIQQLTESAWDQVVAGIAAGRGLTRPEVEALIDRGPWLAEAAREAGLIDRVGFRDEVYDAARQACGGDVTLRYADQWSRPDPLPRRIQRRVTRPPAVAVVDVAGGIAEGRSRQGFPGRICGSATVAGELRAAAKDKGVAAVVLRVDSPGGSSVASYTIWQEVRRVREAGKPVVVSMGTLAASGGYLVSCGADVIVADPMTLTGSIGVVGGKAVVSDLVSRIGVTSGVVERAGRR